MKKKEKKFPDFNKMTYQEEANWWDTHDLGDYWDQTKDVEIIFDLNKPKDETIVLRLQKSVKDNLAKVAKSKGVNVSALARMWLTEKLQQNGVK
jgi:predicted DNA binding CopG/RHH family protein